MSLNEFQSKIFVETEQFLIIIDNNSKSSKPLLYFIDYYNFFHRNEGEKAPKINKRLQNFLSFLEERKTKGRKRERKNENSSANSLHDEALSRI